MSDNPAGESPFNSIPPIVVALALLIGGIEVIFQLASRGILGGADGVGWRLGALQDYAFSGPILQWMVDTSRWPVEHLKRFLTYPFVHVGFGHAAFVIVFLLALGKMVGEVFGTIAVLVVFFGSAIAGALGFWLIGAETPLIGGFPGAYGLIGSYTFMLWLSYGATGQSRLSAFQLIAFLMGLQLLFGLLFGADRDWFADLIGFFFGFGISFALVPGAIQRLRDKLRQR